MDEQICIQDLICENQFFPIQNFQLSQFSESFNSYSEPKRNNSFLVESTSSNLMISNNNLFRNSLFSEDFNNNTNTSVLFPKEQKSKNQSAVIQPDDRFIPNRQATNTSANTYLLSSKENNFILSNVMINSNNNSNYNQGYQGGNNGGGGGGMFSSEGNNGNFNNNSNTNAYSSSSSSSTSFQQPGNNQVVQGGNMFNNNVVQSTSSVSNNGGQGNSNNYNHNNSQGNSNNINNGSTGSSFNQLMEEMILNNNNSKNPYYNCGDNEKDMFPGASVYQNKPRIMSFKSQIDQPMSMSDSLQSTYEQAAKQCDGQKTNRFISPAPEKILDAPELRDDYYLNLMDWGHNGILAVCLNQSVYLWNSYNGDIQMLLSSSSNENYVSSVSWMNKGNCLAVGFANNVIQIWDTEKFAPLRNLMGHKGRISSMSWNNYILSSGSRDTCIINHDVRNANNVIAKLVGHTQEVCGLKWSCDGTQLASGGNDNNLMIWDLNLQTARHTFSEHKAAVKALAWCPWQQNLLASGGGTADQTMKFWSTDQGQLVKSLDAESQVCSILWNQYDKELISSHGYSKNQLCVWQYPTLEQITELHGHQNRVLHMSLSPDGSTVCSAASDETLRFWKVFDVPALEKKNQNNCGLQTNTISLR